MQPHLKMFRLFNKGPQNFRACINWNTMISPHHMHWVNRCELLPQLSAQRTYHVFLCIGRVHEPGKNSWTDRDAILGRLRWVPRYHCFKWGCILAQTGKMIELPKMVAMRAVASVTVSTCLVFFCIIMTYWRPLQQKWNRKKIESRDVTPHLYPSLDYRT